MSPLTKLFVIMLVVMSMLLTAGTVVFVNTTSDFKGKQEQAEKSLAAERARSEHAVSDAVAQRENAINTFKEAQTQIEQIKQSNAQQQQLLVDKDATIASVKSDLVQRSADASKTAEALKAAQDTVGRLNEQLVALRTTNDDLLKKSGDVNLANADLLNKLTVTEKERQYLVEQVSELKGTTEKQAKALSDAGIPQSALAHAGIKGGAPAINGVVREVRTIAGKPYATISVGANDSVTRGMEFKVVDRGTGNFLGVLTVDSVEQNEATGRIDGPRLGEIRPNVSEVRTQL